MRENGGLTQIAALLESTQASVHRSAILLLGNLCTAAVDPLGCELTKRQLKPSGCFARLIPHLWSSSLGTLLYTLGAVQNTCATDIEFIQMLERQGAIRRLEQLTISADPRVACTRVEEYAAG